MKISVITPSYNQAEFIDATVQSVLNQNTPADEYIIVDGQSTDETLQKLAPHAQQIKIISESDHGQTDALNKGFKLAQHEIIGWLNSDDLYFPETLETVKKIFETDDSVDVVYGDAIFINSDGKKIGYYPVESNLHKTLLSDCVLCQPAVFFKKSLLDKHGFLNESIAFGMDYDLWLRLLIRGAKFHYIPKTLAQQRLHDAAKTFNSRVAANKETCELIYHYSGKLPLHRAVLYSAALASDDKENGEKYWKSFFAHFKHISQKFNVKMNFESVTDAVNFSIKKFFKRRFG